MNCKICSEEFKSFGSLSKHIKFKHKISSQEYYDMHRDINENVCVVCGNGTRFIDINLGYKQVCGSVCGCTLHRRNLKADPIKFAAFKKKCSDNAHRQYDYMPGWNGVNSITSCTTLNLIQKLQKTPLDSVYVNLLSNKFGI
jgi:hypothetical protein